MIIGKILLSVGLGLSFLGLYLMIKASTSGELKHVHKPEAKTYGHGEKCTIGGYILQVLGVWTPELLKLIRI
jgi:hypothetical protein